MESAKNFDNRSVWKGAVAGLIAGIIGSWVKSKVETPLQKLGEKMMPPTDAQKSLRAANITENPLDIPPSARTGKVSGAKTNEDAAKDINYLFGTTLGIGYGIVAEEILEVTVGAGVPIGAAMWAGTQASTFPAVDSQNTAQEIPASLFVREFGAPLVYGLTVELIRRAVRSRL